MGCLILLMNLILKSLAYMLIWESVSITIVFCLSTYFVTCADTLPLPISHNEYILDVCSLLESQDLNYKLCFYKMMWYNSLNLENSLYRSLLYHQVCIKDMLCNFSCV